MDRIQRHAHRFARTSDQQGMPRASHRAVHSLGQEIDNHVVKFSQQLKAVSVNISQTRNVTLEVFPAEILHGASNVRAEKTHLPAGAIVAYLWA